jgi:glycosyltransferase involved in cell wall biosynthesis
VEGESKAALLEGAWMFVLPSFSENFGIAVVEALSAGIPCVLGEGIAIARVVADAGAGVTVAPTAEAVASGMRQLLDHYQDHERMREHALVLARDRYSVVAMSVALSSLYREVTGKNRVRG